MKQINFKNSPLYQKGHKGELIIKQILQKEGFYIIPSYDYSGNDGKAPKLYGLNKDFVLPDLDISKEGDRQWAEVKTKSSATYTYITKQLEHGIPLKHYNHYLDVQKITGTPVWLYIFEEDTRFILKGKLNQLMPRIYKGNKMSKGGMAFFPRKEFYKIGHFLADHIFNQRDVVKISNFIDNTLPIPVQAKICSQEFGFTFSLSDIIFLKKGFFDYDK
jgi:hypothetical protein